MKENENKQLVKDDVTGFYKKLNYALFNLSNEEFYKYFENAFSNGNRKYYQKNIAETKSFDDTWIKTVESYFPSLDKITRDPRSILKYEEDIVAVERAKKTGSKSVRHLASHTEYIRDIDEQLNVTPKKILVENAEQDYAIYENRFIMTLINRLYLFVKNRYEIIKNNVESSQKDHVSGNVQFEFNKTQVEMNLDMTIIKDLDDKAINEHNHELLARTEKLNGLITGLKNCKFMQMLKGRPAVHPPIMKTNIITKNPEFRNAYNLWIFLDKYSILGYDVTIKEKDLEFDDAFLDEVNKLFAMNYAIVLGNQTNRKEKYDVPDGYEILTKKKTKIVSQNPKDFVPNPDLIEIEESHLNEYFLQKYKSLLDESIQAETFKERIEEPSDAVIKRSLRQTTEIVNSLYDAKFELSEESDILHRLEEADLEKEYANEREQLRYAKLIREVKEVDYNNFFRTERRLLRALSNTNTKMIKKLIEERKYEDRVKKIKEIEAKIEQLKKENEERAKVIDALNDHKNLMNEEKEKLLSERNKVINKVDEEMKKYDEAMYKKYEEERLRVLQVLEEEKAKAAQLKEQEKEASRLRKEAMNNMIAFERDKAQAEMDEKFNLHKQEMEKELNEIQGIEAAYKERLRVETENVRKEYSQKEKEAVAIFKVQQYEEFMDALQQMQLEEAEMAYKKEQEEKELKLREEQELKMMQEEEKEKAALSLAESLKKAKEDVDALHQEERMQEELRNKELAELEKMKQEQERLAKENEEMALKAKIEADLLALENEIKEEQEKDALKDKEEQDEQERLEALKEEEKKRLEKEKFEQEQKRIEEELENSKKKAKDEEKQRLMALNAMQREKEAKAISKVQDFEKGLKEEQEEKKRQEENEKQALKAKAEQEKFEEERLKIEAQIEENAKLEEKKAQVRQNAVQREKENKAISKVQEFEKLNKDAKSEDNA